MPHASDFIPQPTVRRRSFRWIAIGMLLVGGLIVPPVQATTYRSTLAWINTASDVTANLIDRSLDGVNFTPLATVAPTPASYQDDGLAAGSVYYYRVRSRTPAGNSDYSATTVGTTPPALIITSPTDYQTVTNGAIKGTARGATGLKSVKINGQTAAINGTNWFATVALRVGTNTLTVIATDKSAEGNSTTQIVHSVLLPAPAANFTGFPTTGRAPLLVNFTDTSTGPITGRIWTFGDGTTSTAVNPAHTYSAPGNYTVTLTVFGPAGSTQLKRAKFITVSKTPRTENSPTTIPNDPAPPLQIVAGPLVTNALTQLGDVAVIVAGEPAAFQVIAADILHRPLEYSWAFGDQQAGAGTAPVHTYPATTCASYPAQVVVNTGPLATTGTVHVATACQLELTKVALIANFVKANADRFTLTATITLDSTFQPAGQTLAVDLGHAQVSFRLKQSGHGTSAAGKCRLTYNTVTRQWDLTVKSKKGNWRNLWAAYNLVPGPLSVPAIPVTVPVIVVVGHAAFAAEPQMQYSATTERLGYAY